MPCPLNNSAFIELDSCVLEWYCAHRFSVEQVLSRVAVEKTCWLCVFVYRCT